MYVYSHCDRIITLRRSWLFTAVMLISVLLLILDFLCSCQAAQESDDCSVKANSLCITRETFWSWDDARDYCINRGGDLSIPRPGTTDVEVWIGGRVFRVWATDNSSYYFGIWNKCLDDIDEDIAAHPSNSLSECLQSCSSYDYAFVKKSQCACSNGDYYSWKSNCDDPFGWGGDEVKGTDTHRFQILRDYGTGDDNSCKLLVIRYHTIKRVAKKCDKEYSALCQSVKHPADKKFVKYGSSFLWITKCKIKWKYAGRECEQDGGTLAKLDWESPLLEKRLSETFRSRSLWLGVGPAKWRFIDGRLVSDTWPDIKQYGNGECLVWERSELEARSCWSYSFIPAACTLQYETTTASTTALETPTGTDPPGVSTVNAFSSVDMETYRPSSQSSGTTVVTHQPSKETDHVTNASLGGVTFDMTNTKMSSPAVYIGVGVALGVLVLCVVAVLIVRRVWKKSPQSGCPDSRLCREQRYNNNVGYDLPSTSTVAMVELSTNDNQASGHINCKSNNNSVREVLYSSVNAREPSCDTGMAIHKSNDVAKKVGDGLQQEADYDKLAVPKASGSHTRPTQLHSDVPGEDPTYVNYNNSSVTSPYDHVITKGSPKKNNSNYDELHFQSITCTTGPGDFSVYYHVSSDI